MYGARVPLGYGKSRRGDGSLCPPFLQSTWLSAELGEMMQQGRMLECVEGLRLRTAECSLEPGYRHITMLWWRRLRGITCFALGMAKHCPAELSWSIQTGSSRQALPATRLINKLCERSYDFCTEKMASVRAGLLGRAGSARARGCKCTCSSG